MSSMSTGVLQSQAAIVAGLISLALGQTTILYFGTTGQVGRTVEIVALPALTEPPSFLTQNGDSRKSYHV